MKHIITIAALLAFSSPAYATNAGSMSGSTDHFFKNPACYIGGKFDAPWLSDDSEKLCNARGGVWTMPGTVVTPIHAPVQDTPKGSNSGAALDDSYSGRATITTDTFGAFPFTPADFGAAYFSATVR